MPDFSEEKLAEVKTLMRQAQDGEFSPLGEFAETVTALEFAVYCDALSPTSWGVKDERGVAPYQAVEVEGTSYLWRTSDGKYDGWDRPLFHWKTSNDNPEPRK